MEYKSVSEIANLWGISARSVRNYCSLGRIEGAKLEGKTWMIPACSIKPSRKDKKTKLVDILLNEKKTKIKGGIYHKIQVDLTYNSNRIEGSKLSHDQTRYIYETNTVGLTNEVTNIDDIIETVNHFKCIDYIIDNYKSSITPSFIKTLHKMLKTLTSDSNTDWFVVGDYKKMPNEVGGVHTTDPKDVSNEINKLLEWYNCKTKKTIEDIIEFHYKFETIHPFQDGNGRVGRLLMFKECLKHNIVPFVISDDIKLFYYRGLKEWNNTKGYLMDTCLFAQDQFKKVLNYYKIDYRK